MNMVLTTLTLLKKTEDAINFIKENCYDNLKDFKFFDAEELELDLRLKEVKKCQIKLLTNL